MAGQCLCYRIILEANCGPPSSMTFLNSRVDLTMGASYTDVIVNYSYVIMMCVVNENTDLYFYF